MSEKKDLVPMPDAPDRPVKVGDLVHYANAAGEHLAAVVVRVLRPWDSPAQPGLCNLQAFCNGPEGLVWMQSIPHSSEHEPGTWHRRQ